MYCEAAGAWIFTIETRLPTHSQGIQMGEDCTGWSQVSLSGSTGDYGPFGASYPFQLAFHCIQNSCAGLDNLYCGNHGYCQDGECVCNGCYGGYFCEFGWKEPYVVNEYITYSGVEYSNDPSYYKPYLANMTCL